MWEDVLVGRGVLQNPARGGFFARPLMADVSEVTVEKYSFRVRLILWICLNVITWSALMWAIVLMGKAIHFALKP